MHYLEQLQTTALFAELDGAEVDALRGLVSFRELDRGTVLFFEGEPAGGFFVLIDGSLRIYKSSAEGREYTLHRVAPGQMFAEAAIFKGDKYPANCIALERSVVAFFPKTEFLNLVVSTPTVALKIMGGLSSWLRELTVKLENLSLKDVQSRLATYLLGQVQKRKKRRFTLPTSKSELARELGTISETLSRTLKKFKDLQVIAEDHREIEVLDFDRLEAIADGEKI